MKKVLTTFFIYVIMCSTGEGKNPHHLNEMRLNNMTIDEMIARLQEIATRHPDLKLDDDRRYDFELLLEEIENPNFYIQ